MTKHSNRLNIKRVGSTPAAYPHLMSASPTMSYMSSANTPVYISSAGTWKTKQCTDLISINESVSKVAKTGRTHQLY